MDLPSSAISLLQSTYASVTNHLKLNHKQRRKLWKKYKRKKKRIINYFALRAINGLSSDESNDSANETENSDLPQGELTNYAIISYFKNKLDSESLRISNSQYIENGAAVQRSFQTRDDSKPLTNVELEDSSAETQILNLDENEEKVDNVEESLQDGEANRPEEEINEISDFLAQLDEEVERWQNPPAPDNALSPEALPSSFITHDQNSSSRPIMPPVDDNRPVCMFYSRVGACRFYDKCSRKHTDPVESDTLVFLNMFQTFAFDMADRMRSTGDSHDISLEHSEQDLYDEFKDFYEEIKPEFEEIGEVSDLYVSRNHMRHLRGNVYVQYKKIEDAKNCQDKMLGRYFGGKPLFCKYLEVKSWREVICGIDLRGGNCSRGGQCNFLHVFKMKHASLQHYTRLHSTERRHSHSRSSRRTQSHNSRFWHRQRAYSPRQRHSADYSDYDNKSSSRSRKRNREIYSPNKKTLKKRSSSISSDESRKRRKKRKHEKRSHSSRSSSREPSSRNQSDIETCNGTMETTKRHTFSHEGDIHSRERSKKHKKSKKKKKHKSKSNKEKS